MLHPVSEGPGRGRTRSLWSTSYCSAVPVIVHASSPGWTPTTDLTDAPVFDPAVSGATSAARAPGPPVLPSPARQTARRSPLTPRRTVPATCLCSRSSATPAAVHPEAPAARDCTPRTRAAFARLHSRQARRFASEVRTPGRGAAYVPVSDTASARYRPPACAHHLLPGHLLPGPVTAHTSARLPVPATLPSPCPVRGIPPAARGCPLRCVPRWLSLPCGCPVPSRPDDCGTSRHRPSPSAIPGASIRPASSSLTYRQVACRLRTATIRGDGPFLCPSARAVHLPLRMSPKRRRHPGRPDEKAILLPLLVPRTAPSSLPPSLPPLLSPPLLPSRLHQLSRHTRSPHPHVMESWPADLTHEARHSIRTITVP